MEQKPSVAEAIRKIGKVYRKPESLEGLIQLLEEIFDQETGLLEKLRLKTMRSRLFELLERYQPLFKAGTSEININAQKDLQELRWGSTTQRGLEGMAEIYGYDTVKKNLLPGRHRHPDRQVSETTFIKRAER